MAVQRCAGIQARWKSKEEARCRVASVQQKMTAPAREKSQRGLQGAQNEDRRSTHSPLACRRVADRCHCWSQFSSWCYCYDCLVSLTCAGAGSRSTCSPQRLGSRDPTRCAARTLTPSCAGACVNCAHAPPDQYLRARAGSDCIEPRHRARGVCAGVLERWWVRRAAAAVGFDAKRSSNRPVKGQLVHQLGRSATESGG